MPKKKLKGKVISDKMQKTVVVEVESTRKHSKYKRNFLVHKKYKAHDEKGECRVGEEVVIEECRPISKDKRWRVINKISRNRNDEKSRNRSETERETDAKDLASV